MSFNCRETCTKASLILSGALSLVKCSRQQYLLQWRAQPTVRCRCYVDAAGILGRVYRQLHEASAWTSLCMYSYGLVQTKSGYMGIQILSSACELMWCLHNSIYTILSNYSKSCACNDRRGRAVLTGRVNDILKRSLVYKCVTWFMLKKEETAAGEATYMVLRQ